ncbi:TetR/AcrR family transcriptional regulator [Agromyces mediolanus]|uniref:TetR/AcrR family transcriptional regulator n=1 Tax=Agromyces mediolanus TaxID=41986 RepID=UPI00203F6A85|nr:TetR/AcrR family transcriptional regulator [Agromyces mediolanus]MCM3658346.1 TetR/AcrR family transcriptional regulator [Agromyces mediolanus]
MKPGPRRSISQADIVDAAFEILEEKGFAAVSVRAVAAALGLTPTALYTYFPSKGALQAAMIEQLLAGVAEAGTDPEPAWRERIHLIATALRDRIAAHAGSIALLTSGPLDGERSRDLAEALIAAFADAGLGGDDAARAGYAVRAQVIGAAALDAAAAAVPEETPTPQTLWKEPSRHPRLEASAHLGLDSGEADAAARRWSLDRLIDGFVPTR